MRLRLAVAAALLLSASSLLAQNRKTEVTLFASDPGYGESSTYGSTVTGGVGLALNQWWTSQISTEFSITAERHYTFTDAQRLAVYRYPIDALAQYHFLNGTRWQPYIGIGARSADRVTPEINAGVLLQLSQHFDLRLDGRMTQDQATDFHDSLAKFSIGLGWRF